MEAHIMEEESCFPAEVATSDLEDESDGKDELVAHDHDDCTRANRSSCTIEEELVRDQDMKIESENHILDKIMVEVDSESAEIKKDAPQVQRCVECGKTFPSFKSLYGHLRLHPDRGYKGANPPPDVKNRPESNVEVALPAVKWSVKAKRGRKGYAIEEKDIVIVAAEILLLMTEESKAITQGEADENDIVNDHDGIPISPSVTDRRIKGKKMEELEVASESILPPLARGGRRYKCNTCNKTFSSHQALGGHRASHNKHKNSAEEVLKREEDMEYSGLRHGAELVVYHSLQVPSAGATHQCQICRETFPSGQALGGHKRRHYNEKNGSAFPPAVDPNHRPFRLDLNKVPRSEAEAEEN